MTDALPRTVSNLALAALLTALVAATGCAPSDAELQRPSIVPGAEDGRGSSSVPVAAPDWSAGAEAGIAAGQYAPQADGANFRVTNLTQDLRGVFRDSGLTVTDRAGAGEVSLSLGAWGREGALMVADAAIPEAGPCLTGGAVDAFGECLRRVDYVRPGLVEWWENRPEGLEQGFTVSASPAGDGALVFELGLTGAIADVEDDEALLVREVGGPLRFSGLVAHDARGRELPAWMEESDEGLRLVVDDSDAIGTVTVDPLLTTASWTAESDQETGLFGYSVASAGDVNGDGYGDLIVSALGYDNGSTNEGRAFVYLGSSSGVSTSASWTAEPDQADAYFGYSVASAGDVNGDGYGDVVVGAPHYDNGSTDEGRAYLYLGSSSGLSPSASWTAESDQADAYFGHSVASAGDVNGDGYGDVVVGAPAYTNGSSMEGRASLYLGSSSGLATSASWTAESNQSFAYYGAAVAPAGDVNGDGYSDVVVGAYFYTNGSTYEGRAFLYLGSSSGLGTSASWTAESDQAFAYFGYSVAAAGDVNGDGYGDVVVGAYLYDNGSTDEGRAYVYLGSSSGLGASASWTAESDQDYAEFGYSVASAGDTNGDGYGDVIVGAVTYDNGSTDEGRAYVYLGSSSGLSTSASWTAESDQDNAYFGYSVASAGDVNGDGSADVVVGATSYDSGSSNEGRAYLYLGATSCELATTAVWTAESNQATANFGYSVASAGDVNGDGYGDVVVGAYLYDNGSSNEGRAYVYLGSASGLASSASWTAESNQANANFGVSVGSAGDVNGDGYGDVIVGAYLYDNGSTNEGRAYVYLGSSTGLATSAAWTAESNQANAQFGYSVASAGDVNGDGYGDVVVGARLYDSGPTDDGRAYVYLGSSSGLATASAWTAQSSQAGAYFGQSVASAGDVNGDSYGDVVVGANLYDNGSTDEGRAYVYLGSSTGLATTTSWTAESDQATAYFGYSVASAGDVNGDGYGDVVVGAPNEAWAGLYLGSSSGLATSASWTAVSDQAAALFGWSVASAGDVNGDGYGDVVVGARTYTNGESYEGRAFLYLGSAFGLATSESWTAESDQAQAGFGYSVASAGDVNGDGYGDMVVGANSYTNGSSYEGGAFVYQGSCTDDTAAEFTFYADADGDGYGDSATSITASAPPAGYVADSTDCDDTSAAISPAAIETCDVANTDEDCDGLADNDDSSATGASTFYVDGDGDGYGSATTGTYCDQPGGYVADTTDCDDTSAAISPAATEACDASNTDENCDGLADNDDSSATGASTFYVDGDGDGYGSATTGTYCDQPGGYVADSTDCDDTSPAISPAATEVCDASNIDEDCDGLADNDDSSATGASTFYVDGDGDGYGSATTGTYCDQPGGYVADSTDCDDTSAAISPAATEACDASNTDEDCDGLADDDDSSATGGSTFYVDSDGDGYGSATTGTYCDLPGGYVVDSTDCDDTSAAYNPAATEADCTDPADYNCDGSTGYANVDGDAYAACEECDDTDAAIHPAATEVVGDEVDQNCDGMEDCYLDGDDDGYIGDSGAIVASADLLCDGVGEALATAPTGDCDDASDAYNPGALEEDCTDPADYNCDGSTGYADADADGFAACKECDDAAAAINPDADEVCDGADNDCDGTIDVDAIDAATWYADADDDGYTNPDVATTACDEPAGYAAATDDDCDDADATVYPGGDDIPDDGVDQDCVGGDATLSPDSGNDTAGAKDGAVGCRGCATTDGSAIGWLAGLLGFLAVRRRVGRAATRRSGTRRPLTRSD